jgi:uncharacterized protein YaiI (UPF0178 family)
MGHDMDGTSPGAAGFPLAPDDAAPSPAGAAASVRVLVDADACPVKAEVRAEVAAARRRGRDVAVLWFATADHEQADADRWVRVAAGRDAVDHALFAAARPGDLVVTGDHGLAALCLGRGAHVLHPDGWPYSEEAMPALLTERYLSARIRRAGGRTRGPRPRRAADDAAFRALLRRVLAGPP